MTLFVIFLITTDKIIDAFDLNLYTGPLQQLVCDQIVYQDASLKKFGKEGGHNYFDIFPTAPTNLKKYSERNGYRKKLNWSWFGTS